LTKGLEAAGAGATVVFVLPARTDTRWFHNLVQGKAEVRFVPGRIKFEHANGKKNAAPFPSMVVIYRPPNCVAAPAPSTEMVTTATTTGPKPDPSSLPTLVKELETFLRNYVSFAEDYQPLPLALWAIATHIYELFDAFPYLVLTAATKNSGKTRVMELMAFLSARSHSDADITPAALFALIETNKPTLFLDESERFAVAKSGFRGLLNSGYRRGSTVTRRQGHGFAKYRIYCPKCFALIGDVFDTMRDRSIVLNLRRGRAPHRFLFANASAEGATLREKIASTVGSYSQDIADTYSALPQLEFLTDREEEIWGPLFVVCRVFCPDRWQELERVAMDISTGKTVQARKYTDLAQHEDAAQQIEYGERALRDLIQIIKSQRRKAISTAAAIPALRELPTAPWRAFRGEGIKPNIEGSMLLASLLEPFGVRPGTIRLRPKSEGASGSTAKGYVLAALIEAAQKTGVFL
jgi:hypothetical protein